MPARDNEPVSVLNIEVCSEPVEDELSEPVKTSVRPLNRDVMMEIEPDKDLKSEVC